MCDEQRDFILQRKAIAYASIVHVSPQVGFIGHVDQLTPEPWRAETFVAEARQRGVTVNGAEAFAADAKSAVQAIRICLGPPRSRAVLDEALRRLTRILEQAEQPNMLVV